jgi:LysR family transcriptional regulator, transcriptional activator for aaeXAB operon
MQRIDAFAIFAKVGELGSISGAARALGIPKANVSRAVAKLETDYKVALIERTTRRVVLTEIGRKLHNRCDRLLAEVEATDAEIAAFRGDPAGKLRIGCSSATARHVSRHFPDFLERYPAVDLRVKVSDHLVPEPEGFDVVLHTGWLSSSPLVARKLSEVAMVLVASRDYLRTRGVPTTPDELTTHSVAGHYCAKADASVAGRRALAAKAPPLELTRGRERFPVSTWHRFASNDPIMLVEMVRSGLAIAPLDQIDVETGICAGDLARVLPDYTIANLPALYAVHGSRTSTPPKLRVFLDFIGEKTRSSTEPSTPEAHHGR